MIFRDNFPCKAMAPSPQRLFFSPSSFLPSPSSFLPLPLSQALTCQGQEEVGERSSNVLSQQKPEAALLGPGLGLLVPWPVTDPLRQQLVPETSLSPRDKFSLGQKNGVFLRASWMKPKSWVQTTEPSGSPASVCSQLQV